MTRAGFTAKDAILAAVRAGLTDVPEAESADAPVVRHYRRDRAVDDPIGRLRSRLSDIDVGVAVCPSTEVADRVSEALSDVGSGPVVIPPGFPDHWRPSGLDLKVDDGQATAQTLADYTAAVTGCAAAIAETGTLSLDTGDVSGRRLLSLVPDVHVCVVREEDIVADVPQALAAIRATAALTFVSGPSATVDIELVRTVGVHGPRQLKVVIVADN